MIAFHLTRLSNLESIQNYGILPTVPQNKNHLYLLKEWGWCNDNDEIIYLWRDDGNLDKYVIDLIYAKYYIHPRIDYWNNIENNPDEETLISEFHKNHKDKLFGVDKDKFVLLKTDEDFIYEVPHFQDESEDELCTSYHINTKYTHWWKPLVIHYKTINSFEILQYYNVSLKNKKLNIS